MCRSCVDSPAALFAYHSLLSDSYDVRSIAHLPQTYLISLSFGKEFTTAVEQKQIAQQDAERAKFVVEKAEQERQAAVIRAEGEAEAANTISAAINKAGDAFVQFRKIEASREIGESSAFY